MEKTPPNDNFDNVHYLRPSQAEPELGILPAGVDGFLQRHTADIEQLPDEFRSAFTAELQTMLSIGEGDYGMLTQLLQQYQGVVERGGSLYDVGSKIGDEEDLPPLHEGNRIADEYEEKHGKEATRRRGRVALEIAASNTAEQVERQKSMDRHPAFRKRTQSSLRDQPVRPDRGDLPPGVVPLPQRRSGRYPHPLD